MKVNSLHSIVNVHWLKEHLNDNNIVILDATIPKAGASVCREKGEMSCIKNARFFDLKNKFSDQSSPYPNTIVKPSEFQLRVRALGICNDSCIVVYDDYGIYSSARVWWLFKTFGFDNIVVLDGGFPLWKANNYPVEKFYKSHFKKGNLEVSYTSENVNTSQDILSAIDNKEYCIVDARSRNRFYAIEKEPRPGMRSGHIPGSKNIPYTSLQHFGEMKNTTELTTAFNEVNPDQKPMIFTCGSGVTACILALASDMIGFKNTSVYDGSWSEWGSNHDLPIDIS